MKETAVVFITLLLLLTIISIFGGAMKPAQMQAPQNHNSFFLNAHEGYENAGMGAPQYGASGPQTSSSQMPHGMPFVSEEFASF